MSSNDPVNRVRRPLFIKYFFAFFGAVVIPLLISGFSEAWFGYHDRRAFLDARLRVEAVAAAGTIKAFLDGIRDQLNWTVHLPWHDDNLETHRIDALRLLRQVPAVIDITLIDASGRERLKISRIQADIIDSATNWSRDPAFVEARRTKTWYGPVILHRNSEPHMLIAVAGHRSVSGVAVAQINLSLIWEVISKIRVGGNGQAFVADSNDRLVAHSNISLVLKGADTVITTHLASLRSAFRDSADPSISTADFSGHEVLVAMAPVTGAGWSVFAEEPIAEAYAPIRTALWRLLLLLCAGAVFALALAYLLARRMTGPIQLLEKGAARIGAGQFDYRIELGTGDELAQLAARFNDMARELAAAQGRSERIARLKRFLSPQVADIIESYGDHSLLEARHTEVVVIFCDLRGFTHFSSSAEPAEIMRILAGYYDAVGHCIVEHGATLTHFSGDGLMALVNAPVPSPDDPVQRALDMAVDMQKAMQRLLIDWHQHGHELGFGVGLAQGEATVGIIGYEGRYDYTAIGNVVNLASRLCASARDGQILVDANAAAAASGKIKLDALGCRNLKGFVSPVAVYALTGLAASPYPQT